MLELDCTRKRAINARRESTPDISYSVVDTAGQKMQRLIYLSSNRYRPNHN